MKKHPFIVSLATLLALTISQMTAADNGIEVFEIPYSHTEPYIECLGEGIEATLTAVIRTHLIETQDGGVHYVENWFFEGTAVGLDSGRTWAGGGPSPYRVNSNGSQYAESWEVLVKWKPLDGGPKMRERWPFNFVYDANGVPHLEVFEPLQYDCFGGGND